MSNNVKLEALLNAVGRASRPLNAIRTASKSLAGDIRDSEQSLRDLNVQAARIDGFRKASAQLSLTGRSLAKAKQEAAALAIQFKNIEAPTLAQSQALDVAKKSAAELQSKYNGMHQSLQRQRSELSQSGLNTRTLSADAQRVKVTIRQTTQQLNMQRDALSRVNQQQERVDAIKRRYESGKTLAFGIRDAGAAGINTASAGFHGLSQFFAPGVAFSKQMSDTQSTLGIDKNDETMAALRQQAKDIGSKGYLSQVDVAQTQGVLASSGYNANDVLMATDSTVTMRQANGLAASDAVGALSTVQSAFKLPITEIERISDVLTQSLHSSSTSLDDLVAAMKNVAPGAEMAGESLEDTTAMLDILADHNIKGASAGSNINTILSRLDAMTGQAPVALNSLGVSTHDGNGNKLPVEKVFKDIYHAFETKKLDVAQQAEYLKSLFGEEAVKGAGTLVAAAGDGTLDNKRQQMLAAKGSTSRIASIKSDNLDGDLVKLQSTLDGLKIDVFAQEESALRRLTASANTWVGMAASWVQTNPELTQTLLNVATGTLALVGVLGGVGQIVWPLIAGVNVIIAAASMLGTIFTLTSGAIASALGAITWPVIAVVAAIVGGALLIRKYWEPLSAFFGGVIEGLGTAFAPLAEIFSPLAPAFDFLVEKLGSIWQWFTDLLEPVKATQETLERCKNVGVMFGQALANALMAPLNIFNSLSSKASWLLDKLGIIKKESGQLEDTEAKVKTTAVTPDGTYIPPTSTLSGYPLYQPLSAPAGRSFVDNSKREYSITLQGDVLPNSDLDRRLREAVDNLARQERSYQRSSFSHD